MNADDIEQVAVLGAGNMGHGITEVVAMAGYDVKMRDVEQELVDDGYDDIEWSLEKLHEKGIVDESAETVLARIETATDLEVAVEDADLVIEAVPEQMAIKHDVFSDLDEFTPDHAVLASNTSSLSITEIADAVADPGRVVGMHFFNPPVKMDLVEVVHGEETTAETAEAAASFAEAIDKSPIHVRKDVHGFVVNSCLWPYMEEPVWMVSRDETTIRTADAAMVHGRGYPMGPFELADLTGLDVGYHVRKEAGRPIPPLMEEKVESDAVGRKAGVGYYDYEDGDGADYEESDGEGFDWLRVEALVINEAAKLVGDDVATPEAVDTGMRLGAGFPEGPCRRGDDLGIDRVLSKLRELVERYPEDERYEPADYLVELVESGKTGTNAESGFYTYTGIDRDYGAIEYDLDDRGVLSVTLDRPERLNAVSERMREEIEHLLSNAPVEDVRCVTFEGAGDRAFSAGADVDDVAGRSTERGINVTPLYDVVYDYPRPTIAKVHGYCLGGGHELALACDLRIASTDAEFGFPEIKLGLLPGGGGTQRLLRMIGEPRAKELVFRGNRIDAEQAEEWGLINRAVEPETFEETVEEFVADLANGPPIALKVAKSVLNHGDDTSRGAGMAMESQGFGFLRMTEDFEEGKAAFSEDRDPDFVGK
jgi:enoyl-CoA hydratase/3-hydroxyacyl-CoA dehydrogenase